MGVYQRILLTVDRSKLDDGSSKDTIPINFNELVQQEVNELLHNAQAV